MALSPYKLYSGDRNNNVITSTVNLYTTLDDVKNDGELFVYNGQNLYAKRGDINHQDASRIRVGNRQQGIVRALLTKSETIVYVDQFANKKLVYSTINGRNLNMSNAYYKGEWQLGVFEFDNTVNSTIMSDPVNSGFSSGYPRYIKVFVNNVVVGRLEMDKTDFKLYNFSFPITPGRIKITYDHEPVNASTVTFPNLRIVY